MDAPRSILTSGPLTAALRALPSSSPQVALEEPPAGPLRVLPKLLDLSGSVTLAGALQSPLVHPKRAAGSAAELLADVEARLSEIETRLGPVFRGELPVSSHVRMRRELKNPGPSMDGGHPGVRAIRAPFTRYVHGNVFEIRNSLSTLRLELAPRIAGCSEKAARLEAIDAALSEATSREIEVLVARLLARLDGSFVEEAREALQALPLRFEERDLEPWFLPDGWVPRYLKRTGAVLEGLYLHEASLLRALVRSACSPDPAAGRTS